MTGCLLIHGYGGNPLEMEGLRGTLERSGYAARVVCLPGHGDDSGNFARYRFIDWLSCAERAYWDISAEYDKVVLIGLSMGGTLALNLAARFPVSAVVALSTPLYVLNVFPWPLAHARFYAASALAQMRNLFSGAWRGKPVKEEQDGASLDAATWKGYGGPLNLMQLISFRQGCAATRALLPGVRAPLLVMQDERDELVYPENARVIVESVSTPDPRLVMTHIRENETRRHMLPTNWETKDFVVAEITVFFKEKGLDR